jgi:NADH:ubiquinone oxidoreductase subunit E
MRGKGAIELKITVCVGSSCHLKGSRTVVEQLERLILQNRLKEDIELSGTFCTGNCRSGVNVSVDGEMFSVLPGTTAEFFFTDVLPRIKRAKEA